MATTNTGDYVSELELINTWDELKEFESFETVKKALKYWVNNKAAHKRAYLKRKALLDAAKKALADGTLSLD